MNPAPILASSAQIDVRRALGISNPDLDQDWKSFLDSSKDWFQSLNLDHSLLWSAIPEHGKDSALSALEAEFNKHGVRWGNPEQRQQLVRWRLQHLQTLAPHVHKRGMPASASPSSASNTLPSSADAGPSDKAAAVAPSLARSAEQPSAEDAMGASESEIDEPIPEPEAAGKEQGTKFDPVRDRWH